MPALTLHSLLGPSVMKGNHIRPGLLSGVSCTTLLKVSHFILAAGLWGKAYLLIIIISEMRTCSEISGNVTKKKLIRNGRPRIQALACGAPRLFPAHSAAWRNMERAQSHPPLVLDSQCSIQGKPPASQGSEPNSLPFTSQKSAGTRDPGQSPKRNRQMLVYIFLYSRSLS